MFHRFLSSLVKSFLSFWFLLFPRQNPPDNPFIVFYLKLWIVSIFLLISNSLRLIYNPLGTVSYAKTAFSITILFMFSSLARSRYVYLFAFLYYCNYFIRYEIFTPVLDWWSFTGVWVTANLLRSPGLFLNDVISMVPIRPLLFISFSLFKSFRTVEPF